MSAPAEWGVLPRGDTQPSHRLWAQPARQLRQLRNLCSDLQEWIRRHRHGTVVLVRCGTRRWAYRKSAIFTTVQTGARRTSEPETNLSLSWRKFAASSVLLHTYNYGETRVRTKFRFVSKTEIKSRLRKRAIQDSPWKTKKQILAEVRSEIQKHELQAESDRRRIQEFTGIIDSQRMEMDHTVTGCDQSRRDQLLLQEELSEQNRALRETCIRNMRDMEELRESHVLKVEELSRRKLTEDQNTIMELRARIQELQNEINCMNDSRDFKDAELVRSGPSHVPSQPALLPPFRDPGGLLSRNNQPPDIWNSQAISGNVFANLRASSSSPYWGGFNPWISNVTEDTPVLTSTGRPVTCGERQVPDTVLTPRFQPGPSAGNSFDPKEGRFLKNYGVDQQRLQISDLHFDKFPNPNNICLLEVKIQNWGMYLITISYGSYAMDQRSGVGWISGLSEIFTFYQRNSWSRLWVTRRENCFSTE